MQGEGVAREAAGGGRPRCTQRAGAGLDCRLGAGHGEERTWNMPHMVVTLEVSRLSGWLNADSCRVKKDEGERCPRGQGDGRAAAGRKRGVKGKGTTGRMAGAHKTCPAWL